MFQMLHLKKNKSVTPKPKHKHRILFGGPGDDFLHKLGYLGNLV